MWREIPARSHICQKRTHVASIKVSYSTAKKKITRGREAVRLKNTADSNIVCG